MYYLLFLLLILLDSRTSRQESDHSDVNWIYVPGTVVGSLRISTHPVFACVLRGGHYDHVQSIDEKTEARMVRSGIRAA